MDALHYWLKTRIAEVVRCAEESKCVDLESAQKWTVRRCHTKRNAFGLEIVS